MKTRTINSKYSHSFILAIIAFCLISCNNESKNAVPYALTISEGFTDPIGFYDQNPSFSWKLPAEVQSQEAYEITMASSPELLPNKPDLWESGKVDSDQSVYIKYDGPKLLSRQLVFWQVKFWDENGNESQWSDKAFFEMGLLENKDWKAKWISLPNIKADSIPEINRKVHKIQYLRKDFEIKQKIKKARLYITAKGLFEAQINGQKIGNDVLTPGWTPYDKRIETLTYDVGDMLKNGDNVIGLILAEGWHSGRLLFRNYADLSPQIIAQLEVTYQNGKVETLGTDQTWKGSSEGPIRYSSIYDGELYDANYEMPNWSKSDFDDQGWSIVTDEEISEQVLLQPKRHKPIITKLTLPTLSINEPTQGKVVFDLGQNMAGVPYLNIPVKKGQKVEIKVAEMLQKSGEIFTKNYRDAVSTDFYIPAKTGTITWQPKFTFHGFRYVELSGFDESVTPEKLWVTGKVQYSDFEMSGNFSSSHEKLNQLQSNIEWGLRGNFLDIPTDCPQRNERLGWTGDAQVFVPTSLFVSDVHSFWSSWMQSVREDQMENGAIPIVVPNVTKDRTSSGWGDAITVIPWEIYQRTGDPEILEDNYSAMKRWLDFYQSKATDQIVDMFTFGDWLQPYSENPQNNSKGETAEKLVNTAYYARSIDITLQTAKVLGAQQDVVKLSKLLENVKLAFQDYFFNDDGTISKGKPTQTGYLMAIEFDLLTPEMSKKVTAHLLEEIKTAEDHLRTGFLGTPLLAPVLEKINRTDLMYKILFQETYPSWFFSINQGATTMWERWDSYSHKDGFNKGGMNSFNHYAYGAIGQWMYERIAGIKPLEAGYKQILIAPLPGGPLTSAEASYNSPYGKISSSWKKEKGKFQLRVTVPPNTKAKIIIPADTEYDLKQDGNTFKENPKVKLIKKDQNSFNLMVVSGSYFFESILD